MRVLKFLFQVLVVLIAIPVACFLAGRLYQAVKGTKKVVKQDAIDVEYIVT
jgi:hypothetical protein